MEQEIKLHANNTSFKWNIPEGPYSFFSDEDINCFNENGFVVVEDAFSPAEVAQVIDQIDPYEFNVTEALKGLDGGKFFISRAEEITFTTHLVTQSEQLKDFSRHNVFSNICRDLIGPDVRLYWDQAVYKKPGTKDEFPWHQDNGYTFIEPQAYLTCWIALTDTDETNGWNSFFYRRILLNYMFVICPEGNGIDTHRMWEALYLRTVPIIKKNMISNSIKKAKIPVLILNKWSDLSKYDERKLKKFYLSNRKLFSNKYLFQAYWKNKINGYS